MEDFSNVLADAGKQANPPRLYSKKEIEKMFREADLDGLGVIDFDNFLEMQRRRKAQRLTKEAALTPEEESRFTQTFKSYGLDGSATISHKEFCHCQQRTASQLNPTRKYSAEELKVDFEEIDTDHSGEISMAEFLGHYRKKKEERLHKNLEEPELATRENATLSAVVPTPFDVSAVTSVQVTALLAVERPLDQYKSDFVLDEKSAGWFSGKKSLFTLEPMRATLDVEEFALVDRDTPFPSPTTGRRPGYLQPDRPEVECDYDASLPSIFRTKVGTPDPQLPPETRAAMKGAAPGAQTPTQILLEVPKMPVAKMNGIRSVNMQGQNKSGGWSLKLLPHLPALNQFASLENVTLIQLGLTNTHLKTLSLPGMLYCDLRNNMINDVRELGRFVARSPHVSQLYMTGNPCCKIAGWKTELPDFEGTCLNRGWTVVAQAPTLQGAQRGEGAAANAGTCHGELRHRAGEAGHPCADVGRSAVRGAAEGHQGEGVRRHAVRRGEE
jgi:Ca2+-binding EF-hand superfamily protein